MTKQWVPAELLQELRGYVEEVEGEVHTGYSGRFMYGTTCLAVSGSAATLIAVGRWSELVRSELDAYGNARPLPGLFDPTEFADVLLYGVQADDFGRERIYYWPDLGVRQPTKKDTETS